MAGFYIPLNGDERSKLLELARQERRTPREQAVYMLRRVLKSKSPPRATRQKNTTSAKVSTANAGGVVPTRN